MAQPKSSFLTNPRYVFTYDVSGGASGAIAAHVLGQLPGNFVITQAWIDVETTFVSATDAATIALGYTGSTAAFDAAIAISDGTDPWDEAIPRVSDGAPAGAVANFIVVGASGAVNVLATVAVEALTAGKLVLVIDGYFRV